MAMVTLGEHVRLCGSCCELTLDRNGWGASAVDALSTAIVMGNKDAVQKILDHIETIDFSKTEDEVSLFETTIRYLAGMLSGYDLLKDPATKNLAPKSTQVDALLTQSKKLGDVLKFAFDTPSGVPYNNLNITSKGNDGSSTNGLAVTGTLVLEWTRLSDLTGDDEYAKISQKGPVIPFEASAFERRAIPPA
jgi:Glycosyl hydrolase family 47.